MSIGWNFDFREPTPVSPGTPVASSTFFASLQTWRSKRSAPIWLCSSSHCWSQYSICDVNSTRLESLGTQRWYGTPLSGA